MTEPLFGVYGASGYGREVMPLVREQLARDGVPLERLVFIDDDPREVVVNGHRVLTYSQFRAEPATSRIVSLAIADGRVRESLAGRCAGDDVQAREVRATNVVVLDDVAIGEGAILSPFVTLTSNIRIGRHFHANIYSYVGHDCVIGDFVTFAPSVRCNGNVVVEDHAYVGTGAILRNGKPDRPLVIGRGAVVGMGAVVTKNVAAGSTVIGNPARAMEKQ